MNYFPVTKFFFNMRFYDDGLFHRREEALLLMSGVLIGWPFQGLAGRMRVRRAVARFVLHGGGW